MESLRDTLFPGDDEETYAVVDGASCKELRVKLGELHPEHVCLYAGELEEEVKEIAPYLVALPPEHAFTNWYLDEGFGKHWGIFARSSAGLLALRKLFRTFLRVQTPDGRTLLFRYYDPRVLNTYLPTCNPAELATVFGPVSAYLFEEMKTESFVRFTFRGGQAKREQFPALAQVPRP